MLKRFVLILGIFVFLSPIAFTLENTKKLQEIIGLSMDWEKQRQLIINLIEHKEDPADPNVETLDLGWTALDLAASHGDIPLINLLVGYGALVDRENKEGCSPLMTAVRQGHIPVIGAFANLGANLNFINEDSDSALTYAVVAQNLDAIAELYYFGVEIEPVSAPGAVGLAVHLQHLDALALLLAYGGTVGHGIFDGERYIDVFEFAREKNNDDLTYLLESNGQFFDLLHYAFLAKNGRLATLILEARLQPGENLLHAAVRSKCEGILALVIDNLQARGLLAGLIDQRNGQGLTALRLAGIIRSYEEAALLIGIGANPLLGPRLVETLRFENPLHFGLGRFLQAIWPLALHPEDRSLDGQIVKLAAPEIPKEILMLIGRFIVELNLLKMAMDKLGYVPN